MVLQEIITFLVKYIRTIVPESLTTHSRLDLEGVICKRKTFVEDRLMAETRRTLRASIY